MKVVGLSQAFDINCRLNDNIKNDGGPLQGYEFERTLFYQSEMDFDDEHIDLDGNKTNTTSLRQPQTITVGQSNEANKEKTTTRTFSLFESREHLEQHLARIQLESGVEKPTEWRRTPFRVLNAAYRHSGRYFCVYAERTSAKYAVSSVRVVVFKSKNSNL